MRTFSGEPLGRGWKPRAPEDVADELVRVGLTGRAAAPRTGAIVVAVDGRSAGGKSTLAAVLSSVVPGSAVVHTDDVAWHHGFFDWDGLLVTGVLEPVSRGEQVDYRPPAWQERGRDGAITVSQDVVVIFVEGVGASRSALRPWFDAAVWTQSDAASARHRGLARDVRLGRDEEEAVRFWDEWEAHEVTFLREDRPWERADLVVCGTPEALTEAQDGPEPDRGASLWVAQR